MQIVCSTFSICFLPGFSPRYALLEINLLTVYCTKFGLCGKHMLQAQGQTRILGCTGIGIFTAVLRTDKPTGTGNSETPG